ncbi:MAG: glycoside hydrolase family 43 protein [Bacillota bacterium]
MDIQIRDPFVVPVQKEERYYLFGSTDKNIWDGPGKGFDYYIGADLENWEGPFTAFQPPVGFWGTSNFWAPEVHFYRGCYYMFASFKAPGRCRGTQIFTADQPGGPFQPITAGPITPRDWECLDGTLYVEEGQPFIVFCHEWVQVRDGEICAMRLSPDLKDPAGEPQLLFKASTAPWAKSFGDGNRVTDGPFIWMAPDGMLLMLWSSMGEKGYATGVACSETGSITGPWKQSGKPLYDEDGGHGMIFGAFAGTLYLSIHKPNDTPHERPLFLPLRYEKGKLALGAL